MAVTGFEDFAVGQRFTSPSTVVDAAAIKEFAAEFDFQPQHVDEVAAAGTMFGTLVASGWHTGAITMRLMLQSALAGVSGRGMGVRISEIQWANPVLPGDALHLEAEVLELRPSRSKPDRGIVVIRSITRNQRGEAVQDMTSTLIILRKEADANPSSSSPSPSGRGPG